MYRMADCSVVEPFFVFESRQQTGHPQCVLEVDKFCAADKQEHTNGTRIPISCLSRVSCLPSHMVTV
jgi:hypothetical protein